ncbi:hypothetical protein DKT77_17200 [Meridianimarinicoccus roseus]|jgi:hypothetical protein|uniref:Peptidase inhibitor I78 family protein n=1 Tax=Meridianimarinicoccus roseus TaxID=2072018 RepID=A0A2V2LCF9_9RHOB|nr:I78 family peptidase inhibitor [Meridianimarinicoccus roseus]PWR01441.1 hypothetical protein DKT77_17200 [Meridianimarinicoccus roseus]
MRVTLALPLLAACPILISACAPSAPTGPEPAAAPAVPCEASFFENLKGEPIEVVDSIVTPLRVRVLGADDFVPRDFDPNRLTFTTAPDGTVSRIFCG